MQKNEYLLPHIQKCLNRLEKVKHLTKLDLISDYWQVWVTEKNISKTVFNTRQDKFEFTVMLFDLMNAPVTFQSMMNHILHEFLNKSVIMYLNDILIYSDFMNKHWKHVEDVLKKLAEHHLYVKLFKCMIDKFTLKFYEHVVEKRNIQPLTLKIVIINDWSVSINVHEVH